MEENRFTPVSTVQGEALLPAHAPDLRREGFPGESAVYRSSTMQFSRFPTTAPGKAILFASLFVVLLVSSCSRKELRTQEGPTRRTVAVFIPGVRAVSPTYDMLAKGIEALALDREELSISIIEAGTDQSKWQNQLISLAASGSHELIISSNPALPALAAEVAKSFPKQRFIIMDAFLEGNEAIATFQYDQREQALVAGYLAGLATTGAVEGMNPEARIALVAGQEYPAMNGTILPWYRAGARAAAPDLEVDFRVVGNWYDATRAAELGRAAIRAGSDILMPIAGGANQGVLQAAEEAGAKVIWFDNDGFDRKPGTIIGSAVLHQDKAARELVENWLDGTLAFGTCRIGTFASGYIDFIQNHPEYLRMVAPGAREKIGLMVEQLKRGVFPENLDLGGARINVAP